MVAPTGARRMPADHAALPVTEAEIAKTARDCFAVGAGALHLHVRDDTGAHSLDPGRYRAAISAVGEAAPDMAIQVTTESAGRFDVADQLACLKALCPDAASVSIREMARDPAQARQVYAFLSELGTDVQHILYDAGCIVQFRAWVADGTLPDDQHNVICVLGAYTPPRAATPEDLDIFLPFVRALRLDWTACAFGPFEHDCLLAAALHGARVRVGFENSLTRADGTPWATNAAYVQALAQQLEPQVAQFSAA